MQNGMNYSRRKRRKITPDITKSREALEDDYRPQSSTARLPTEPLPPSSLTPGENNVSAKDGDQSALLQPVKSNVSDNDKTARQPEELAQSQQPIPTKPKKILKWNPKTGTIGSPPAKKPLKLDDEIPQKSQLKGQKKTKSLIIKVKYGHDENTRNLVSKKIDAISEASKPIPAAPQKLPKPSTASILVKKEQKNKKSTHPFFFGKATPKPFVPPDKVEDITATLKDTPMPNVTPTPRIPSKPSAPHAIFHGFGNTSKLTKFPGAVEPIWPPNGMTHIRGPFEFSLPIHVSHPPKLNSSHGKKWKYVASEASQKEDIMKATTSKLDIASVKDELENVDNDKFEAPDKCLRLPMKHFESGRKLQKRIRPQISSSLIPDDTMDNSSDDDLHGDGRIKPKAHPAILKAFKMIPNSLSAFDKSECETQSWIHKYAPTTAAEVLQSGREAFILKEWLQTLTVISVESGPGDARALKRSVKGENPAKRKRKSKKLDGFVISSDEGDDDMDEITEPEDDESPWYSQGLVKKTVIRAGDAMAKGSKDSKKLTNAVVISGPNGCGKTAAVYAVAKELGFEVFEINPGSKRSGKDILERVGDMTKNHLVQPAKQDSSQDEDLQRASAALEADIKSGRQGTMNSFFKANPSKGKEAVKSNKPKAVNTISKKQSSEVSNKPKQQKQSLILLEEVDVLYEEDKQFWATVITLILESKRPIVMTCNDESVVPLQALALHAIIRMTPPPIDLAVNYMLLVAANEGHALKREAVASLYKVQRRDLRSSMTELEFWCQMTVGDRRGGFDWFYPRYPRGCDKDSQGDTIRVISEDTYRSGMGWLGRDSINDESDAKDIEEEILHQAWNEWQLDAGDWHETLNMGSWVSKLDNESIEDRMISLEAYDDFTDAMSAADVYACGVFRAGNQVCKLLISDALY
jgi:DNA polymerase III delta prime subunit